MIRIYFTMRPRQFAIATQILWTVISTPVVALILYRIDPNVTLELITTAFIISFVATLIGNAIGYVAFGRRG